LEDANQLRLDKFFTLHPTQKVGFKDIESLKKKHLSDMAIRQVETLAKLLLQLKGSNSIDAADFRKFINEALYELDKRGLLYIKVMPNGRIMIFKRYYCCLGPEEWKRCPKYRCPVWPCNEEDAFDLCPLLNGR